MPSKIKNENNCEYSIHTVTGKIRANREGIPQPVKPKYSNEDDNYCYEMYGINCQDHDEKINYYVNYKHHQVQR
jgi:hypothetical protein